MRDQLHIEHSMSDAAGVRPLMFSIAYRMLGRVAEAEDVVQEAFLRLQRAVYLLREVFDYGYDEISRIVQKTEDNCRQIFARAKRHVESGKPRFETSREKRDELARRFFDACQQGDLDGLVHVLAADAVFYGDGGGKATATIHPVHGRDRVSRLLQGLFTKGKAIGGRVRRADVNGQPGAMLLDQQDRLIAVMQLDIVDDAVQSVNTVVNPDKLRHLGPLSDLAVQREKK